MKRGGTIFVIVACAIFVALYLLVLAQLVGRGAGISLLFAEDLISILFIWFVMAGAVVACHKRDHLEMNLLHEATAPHLHRRLLQAWDVLRRVAELVFLGVFCIALVLMARKTWNANFGALPGFRYGFLYVGVLLAMMASVWLTLRNLIADLRDSRE